MSSTIQIHTAEVQRILGPAPPGKFHHAGRGIIFHLKFDFSSLISDSETIYNEKILKLAFNVSELTFLQAKQQIIEDRLQIANDRNESHAVIEVI